MFVTSAVAAGIGCFAAWFASSTYDSCSAYIMVMMLPVCMSTAHIVMCVWGLSSLQLNGNTVLSITALSCSNSGVPKVCCTARHCSGTERLQSEHHIYGCCAQALPNADEVE